MRSWQSGINQVNLAAASFRCETEINLSGIREYLILERVSH